MKDRAAFYKWLGALEKLAKDLGEAIQGLDAEFPEPCQARSELDGSNVPVLLETAFSLGSMLTGVALEVIEKEFFAEFSP